MDGPVKKVTESFRCIRYACFLLNKDMCVHTHTHTESYALGEMDGGYTNDAYVILCIFLYV